VTKWVYFVVIQWQHSLAKPKCGSITNISWTPDGTQLACGTGSGAILFGHLINQQYSWKHLQVSLASNQKILVTNILLSSIETLEFRDRVIKISIGYENLVVATALQCFVYNEKNWNTPIIIDIANNGRVTLLQQCPEYFCIVDTGAGVRLFSYQGKLISSIKFPAIRPELLTKNSLSISADVVAIKDYLNESCNVI